MGTIKGMNYRAVSNFAFTTWWIGYQVNGKVRYLDHAGGWTTACSRCPSFPSEKAALEFASGFEDDLRTEKRPRIHCPLY